MAGYILIGTLAAFGCFSVVWAVLGWLLPVGRGCALVCVGQPDEGVLSRYKWLRGAGLLHYPLLIVAEEEAGLQEAETEICSREDLLPRLEWERNQFNGTGNGDHTGRHQRRGISEL